MKKAPYWGMVFLTLGILFNNLGMYAQSVKTEHEIRFQNWMSPTNSISIMPSTATTGQFKLILPPLLPSLSAFLTVGEMNGNIATLSWREDDLISKSGFVGDNNTFLGTTNTAPLRFFTDNAERFRLTATGNIGIGTDSPSSIFEIKSDYHTILTAPSDSLDADSLENNQITFFIDDPDTNNTRIAHQAKTADGTTIFGKSLTKVIYHTETFDPPPIPTPTYCYDRLVTVPGAEMGDLVIVNCQGSLPYFVSIGSSYVSATNQVTLRLINHMGQAGSPVSAYSNPPMLKYLIMVLR